MVLMALLEEKESLGRKEYNVPISRFPCSTIGDYFMGLFQPD
jgi:hypothetical protein